VAVGGVVAVAEFHDVGIPVVDERPEHRVDPVDGSRNPVADKDRVDEDPGEGEKRGGQRRLWSTRNSAAAGSRDFRSFVVART